MQISSPPLTPVATGPVRAGAAEAIIDGGTWRAIGFDGIEILRGIDFLVRDVDWRTLLPENLEETLDATSDQVRFRRWFDIAGGAAACTVDIVMRQDGTLSAIGQAAIRRPILVNRLGFTLLHPIAGLAGEPVRVHHPDGSSEWRSFPREIMPSQPARDIAGLDYERGGVRAELRFAGEVFEMEDQRNWTDASFKTYSRPLAWAAPFELRAGDELRQRIDLKMARRRAAPARDQSATLRVGPPDGTLLPEMLLAAERGWLPDGAAAARFAPMRSLALLLRVEAKGAAATLDEALPLLEALDRRLDLEILLDDAGDPEAGLGAVRDVCAARGLYPRHVMALPRAFLKSFQPDATWPTGLQPADALAAARVVFPTSAIGGGMLTNFTEFNRHPPDSSAADYVTHGTSAIVHAADDRSVMETLEALPDIAGSVAVLAPGRPWRLGLVAIGMRSNPYGRDVAANPEGRRLPMAMWDPRAALPFAAAWALGAVAGLRGAAAVALGAPCGPFGMLDAAGRDVPLLALVEQLADWAGSERLTIEGTPARMAALAARRDGVTALFLANLAPVAARLRAAGRDRELAPYESIVIRIERE